MNEADIKKYCRNMEEINTRVSAIQKFTEESVSISNLGSIDFDIEFIALQLRKILELICFSGLIANKKVYSKIYDKYANHWNPKYLLKDLERVNPNYYPRPLVYSGLNKEKVHGYTFREDGFLTKKEFLFLYEKCGAILHSRNPYKVAGVVDFKKSITDWLSSIFLLLSTHEIKLMGTSETWMVIMEYSTNKNVHALITSPA